MKEYKADRAKIFAPFSPLRGLDAAYREKERVIRPKFELLEDREAELDEKLRNISLGDMVKVTYYADGEYKKAMGRVGGFSKEKRRITVVKPICFDDIYDIEQISRRRSPD